MSVCITTNCKRYKECVHTVQHYEIEDAVSYGTYANCYFDKNGKLIEDSWCGEKGNYKMFKPIDRAEKGDVNEVV